MRKKERITFNMLRELGYKISIQHHRIWKYIPPKDLLIMKHETPIGDTLEIVDKPNDGEEYIYCQLQAKGGETHVRIEAPDESTSWEAVEVCSPDDYYRKITGRHNALRKITSTDNFAAKLDTARRNKTLEHALV